MGPQRVYCQVILDVQIFTDLARDSLRGQSSVNALSYMPHYASTYVEFPHTRVIQYYYIHSIIPRSGLVTSVIIVNTTHMVIFGYNFG